MAVPVSLVSTGSEPVTVTCNVVDDHSHALEYGLRIDGAAWANYGAVLALNEHDDVIISGPSQEAIPAPL